MMTWVGYIALSIVTNSAAVLIQRVLVQENKQHPIAFIVIFQAVVGFLVLLYGWFRGFLSLSPDIILSLWFPILASFFLYTLGNICIFGSLKYLEASHFTVAFSSRIFFTAITAGLLLKESLSPLQFVGIGLIFAGIAVTNFSPKIRLENKTGLVYALIGASMFGLASVNDRFILGSMELYSYTGLSFIGPAVILAILQPQKLLAGKSLLRGQTLGKIAFLSMVYAIATTTFFAALKIGESASQVVSVGQVSVIVTVLFAMIFLKEREYPYQKILGAALSFIGILLVV